jgi:hypothetical protein
VAQIHPERLLRKARAPTHVGALIRAAQRWRACASPELGRAAVRKELHREYEASITPLGFQQIRALAGVFLEAPGE